MDTRWNGNHGIGRFSREVSSRISQPFAQLQGRTRPSSALDVMSPARLMLGRDDLLLSPAYNCGPTRARQILTIHDLIHLDDNEQASRAKSAYYERIVRPVIVKSKVLLTVSDASRARAISWLRDDSVDVKVVGNGSSAAFAPSTGQVSSGPPTFLYVGNLRTHKNVDVVLKALRLRPDFRLIMVTPDSHASLKAAAEHGVREQVVALSGIVDEELAELYGHCTATLMPSTLEGFGFPALESFLCGTPVIYWAGCESVAEISDGSGIAVMDAASPNDWADAMDVATDGRASLMRAPASRWRERYDWEQVAGRIDLVISEHLAQ